MKISKKMVLIILIVVIVVIFAIQAIPYVVNKKSNGGTSQSTSTSTSTEEATSFPEQTIDGILFNGVNLSYDKTNGTIVIVLVTNTTSSPMYIKKVYFSLQDKDGNVIGSSLLWIDKTLAANESIVPQAGFSSDVTSAKKIVYTNIVTK